MLAVADMNHLYLLAKYCRHRQNAIWLVLTEGERNNKVSCVNDADDISRDRINRCFPLVHYFSQ